MNQLIKIGVIALIAAAILGGGVYFWMQSQSKHLIAGVPYWGIYTGSELNSAPAFAVYTLLQYWGDNRFSSREIATKFPSEALGIVSTTTMSDFFKQNGYVVSSLPHTDPKDLFSYINKDIPVISTLRITPDHPNELGTERIIIGYSNPDEKIIVHDNQFGNNYELTYTEYERMRIGFSSALIVVPGPELAATLSQNSRSTSYPARLGIMDSESIQRITVKWLEATALQTLLEKGASISVAEDLAKLWEEILAEPDFEQLPPATRMRASFMLARTYTLYLEKHQEALDVLNTTTIPLMGTNFSESFGEWPAVKSPEIYKIPLWTSQPWVLLGLVHERLGNTEAARAAYSKAVEVNPEDSDARTRFETSESL